MNKNSSKICYLLAVLFFVVTIKCFLPPFPDVSTGIICLIIVAVFIFLGKRYSKKAKKNNDNDEK